MKFYRIDNLKIFSNFKQKTMSNTFKSWKTTSIGVIIIAGLAYRAFTEGFGVDEVVMGLIAIGFIIAKDGNKSHSISGKDIGGEIPKDDDE